jgi:hypothetical protein
MDDASAQLHEGSWGLNIGAFERHYTGWGLESPTGTGLCARRKVGGRLRGPRLYGRTLDEVAEKIEEAGP